MAFLVKILLVILIYCQYLWMVKANTLSPLHIIHTVPQHKVSEYVSPYITESYGKQSVNYSTNFIRQPIHQSKQINKIIHPITQISNKSFSNANQAKQKSYSSYAAPASGSAPFSYSRPQRANLVALPQLFPKSLVDQLSSANVQKQQHELYMKQQYNYQPQKQQQEQQQQEQQQQQQNKQYLQTQFNQQQLPQERGQYVDIIKSADLPPLAITQPLLMVEEPRATLLTPNHSRTLEAARILASTLLQASGEAALETPGLAPLSNPNALDLPNHLNSTDVLIVKSQKNAYVIPMPLAKVARDPSMVRALYQMRDQLEKAYTINQFIFIIKPEKINFLNKLV